MAEYPIKAFSSPTGWEQWLAKYHDKADGIWLRFFKKGFNKQSVTYGEALDVALCYGWIDSQSKGYDETSYLQKFTPRGPKSTWSKINKEHVTRLIRDGKMKPSGLVKVSEAKQDGRWANAYDSPKTMKIPHDFLQLLRKDKDLFMFFKKLSKANTYAIFWRLQTAKKPETRERRMKKILEMLKKGEKLY